MTVQVQLLNFLEARYFTRANQVTPILARKKCNAPLTEFQELWNSVGLIVYWYWQELNCCLSRFAC